MGLGLEKPLVQIDGVAIVERVLTALADSAKFDQIVAAVSIHTPLTKRFLLSKGAKIVDTPGKGYSRDLSVVLENLKPAIVFVTPSDIPLLSPNVVNEIVIMNGEEPAMSVLIEKEFVENIGIRPSVLVTFKGKEYCHSGITIFDSPRIAGATVQEQYAVMNKVELAVNVNSKEELKIAKLLIQRAQGLAQDRRLAT